jgi:hypothetical protein
VPATDNVLLSYFLLFPSKITIRLFDLSGKIMMEIPPEQSHSGFKCHNINIKNFPAGIYFIKVEANQMSKVAKIIVIH